MICNSNYHSKSCPSYRYNALKGASAMINNNQSKQQQGPKKHMFQQLEVDRISKVLEIGKFYINKNKDLFQQPKDILTDIDSALSILNARKNNTKLFILKKK